MRVQPLRNDDLAPCVGGTTEKDKSDMQFVADWYVGTNVTLARVLAPIAKVC